jgi:hypothetical protein
MRPAPGGGTEVTLRLPRTAGDHRSDQRDDQEAGR